MKLCELKEEELEGLAVGGVIDSESYPPGVKHLPTPKPKGGINDILIRCELPMTSCRGQAYDGASNMSGIRHRVEALGKVRKALYVHYLVHSLNLCLQDITRKCTIIRDTLQTIKELVQLIKFSSKRFSLFETLKKDLVVSGGEAVTSNLRTLCLMSMQLNHMDCLSRWNLLNVIKLSYLMLSAGEQLSVNLQAKDTTIQEATCGAYYV